MSLPSSLAFAFSSPSFITRPNAYVPTSQHLCLLSPTKRFFQRINSNRSWGMRQKLSSTSSRIGSSIQEASGKDPKAGIPLYKPKSYDELISDAAKALLHGLDDGKKRLEIEFPPLPASISSYKGSSDEFIDANIQLVLALVRKLNEARGIASCIVFPDKPEKRRASRGFKRALELINGISLGSLDDAKGGAMNDLFSSIRNALDFDFEESDEDNSHQKRVTFQH